MGQGQLSRSAAEPASGRRGDDLLFGAAVATRANWLRAQGIPIPGAAGTIRPMDLAEIRERLDEPS